MNSIHYAVEGPTDEPVAKKILLVTGFKPLRSVIAEGKENLRKRLPGLNLAAASMPWLVIRDLDYDDDQSCIPALQKSLLNGHECNRFMCLRFAVRAMEAWLLADLDAFTEFFGIRRTIDHQPESLDDPKQYLIDICRRSKKKEIKEGIPPLPQSKRVYGPDYITLLREFTAGHWDPLKARMNAPSLGRALDCLTRLQKLLDE